MDIKEIQQTPIWELYEKGRNYHRMTGIYTDTDRNYRMYNGNQWDGAKLGDAEPLQKNFIKPIVKYKVSVIHDNLYAIIYSSQNYENREFQQQSGKYCEMLNRYAARVWEKDKMDFRGRRITKDAANNDEGIIYVNFDMEKMMPVNEIVKKNDIYYGNENDDDIQSQPYILIRKRMPVVNAIELALGMGMSESKVSYIIGDNDTLAAIVAKSIKADLLVLLSDIDGLYTADPHKDETAVLLSRVTKVDDKILALAGVSSTKQGTGGMVTKLHAAEICLGCGCDMVIANGSTPANLYDILDGKDIGTTFSEV